VHGALADLHVDAVVLEEVLRRPKHGIARLDENPGERRGIQIFEDDRVVEAREELRLHAVIEEILLLEPVAQREELADVDLAVLINRLGRELDAGGRRGHPAVDLVIERLERPGAQEEHLPGVDVDRGLLELLVLVDGDGVEDPLAFDQRQ
jgi:hypothetical protein